MPKYSLFLQRTATIRQHVLVEIEADTPREAVDRALAGPLNWKNSKVLEVDTIESHVVRLGDGVQDSEVVNLSD